MTHPELRRIPVNGLELALAVWNPDATNTALLLHGYLDQKRSFDAVAQLLPSSWRLIAVDWRGYGESDRVASGGTYHLWDHVRDLDALWDALALQSPVIIGHSMGANAAILLCGSGLRTPRGLALLESLGPPGEAAVDGPTRLADAVRARRVARRVRILSSEEEGVRRIRETNPHLTEDGVIRLAAHSMRALGDGTFTWRWDPALQGPPPYRYTEEGVQEFLRRLTAPLLVVHAQQGYLPPPDMQPDRYACVPHARVEALASVGHHVHVDAPQRLAEILGDWLGKLP
jgi:pimeloyl-ACP methyl ester carboxylesterase